MTKEEELFKFVCGTFEPPSKEPGHIWAHKHIRLPGSSEMSRLNYELIPDTKFFFDQACHNSSLRYFTQITSAQGGKTTKGASYVAWKAKNRPSDMCWYADHNDNAKLLYQTKLKIMFELCAPLKPLLPKKPRVNLVQMRSMDLHILGAEASGNREGKTFSEVVLDETRKYPSGAAEQIENRYKTITNFRSFEFSTAPDSLNKPPWTTFKRGTMHLLFWACSKCGHKQTFRFGRNGSPLYPNPRSCGGFVWDDNDTTHPSELVYNFEALIPTIRYECENPACGKRFEEHEKYPLIKRCDPIATNPMPESDRVSIQCWEAYYPWEGCKWAKIVKKFLSAVVAMKQGKIEPMKVFVTETLGEPWEEIGEAPLEGEILDRKGNFQIGDEWPPEKKCVKQITADQQSGFIHAHYGLVSPLNEFRLVDRFKLQDLEELHFYQKSKGVKDGCVAVDCAWSDKMNMSVLEACSKHGRWLQVQRGAIYPAARLAKVGETLGVWDGWVALYGSAREDFNMMANGAHVRTFIKPLAYDANSGKGAPKYVLRVTWSNDHYKDELFNRRVKGIGPLFEIPQNIPDEFVKQMQTVSQFKIVDAEGNVIGTEWREKGRHDDADALQMQLVLRDINEILRG